MVFPIWGQGAPIYSSTFPPVLPAPENTGIVGIWHPHSVCVSLTEQNQKTKLTAKVTLGLTKKTPHPSRNAAGTVQVWKRRSETPQRWQLLNSHPGRSIKGPGCWFVTRCPKADCPLSGSGAGGTLAVPAVTRCAQQEPAPGALVPSHPPCLSRRRLQRHRNIKSHFILGDTIQRNARNLAARDNPSLFSPEGAGRCGMGF